MDIVTAYAGERVELKLKGRLDASWCEHVSSAISAAIHDGSHQIILNMAEVNYISSAGIRVLMTFYKQLKNIGGDFIVAAPSAEVKGILELTGLGKVLTPVNEFESAVADKGDVADIATTVDPRFESYDLRASKPIALRLIGDTSDGIVSGIKQGKSVPVSFGNQLLGLGLGAIGDSFDECKGRFGEFIAVAGTAAFLPTDQATKADYMLTEGEFVPNMQVVYGLMGDMHFSRLLRFSTPVSETIGLSEIAKVVLDSLSVENAVITIVAETSSLVGAALRAAPHAAMADKIFAFPGIRKHMSFTAERAYQKSVSLVLGVVTRRPSANIKAMVRSLNADQTIQGHLHAAAFSYAPIKKGQIELSQTVRDLFDSQSLLGILHLLNDGREFNGIGESEFVRGACWCGPAILV